MEITWGDGEKGRGPAGRAIRLSEPHVVRDTHSDPDYAPWREESAKRGFSSVVSLPLVVEGATLGALVIYSKKKDVFTEPEMELLEHTAGDLAYGIASLRTRNERREAYEKLKKAMTGIVEVMATAVESRDPYTAGHQRRVSNLSRAIAGELGLSEDQVTGVVMGAMIHDIGKISVPSEILSKPGKLSQAEFRIIQSHCRVGYDIMKGVEFPWPISRVVLHHHERMDGTGYPEGIKGDEISVESRIVAVADVVEAMASHRPYRPALGIEKALEEIESKRGSKFDPDVVDACLKLFREKGFKLE